MASQFIRVEEAGTPQPPGKIAQVLARLLPRANPDFERVYPRVHWWWLELRDGTPVREIGFSADGLVVVLGPFGKNRGLWTDSPVELNPAEYAAITAEEFERQWDQAVREHQGRT